MTFKALGARAMTRTEYGRRARAKAQGKPLPPLPSEPLPERGTPPLEKPIGRLMPPSERRREHMRAVNRAKREAKERAQGRTPVPAERIVGMAAAGLTQSQIGAILGLAQPVVHHKLNEVPNAREEIRELREQLKLLKIRGLHRATPYLMARLAHEIGTPDPEDPDKWKGGQAKDVDAMMRAVQGAERTEGLASGEAHRVEVQGEVQVPVQETLAVLIKSVIAPR